MAIFFQFLPLLALTAMRRASSSARVHFPMEARRLLDFALVVVVVVLDALVVAAVVVLLLVVAGLALVLVLVVVLVLDLEVVVRVRVRFNPASVVVSNESEEG